MIDFVKSGGFWTIEQLKRYATSTNTYCCFPIQINEFEDGFKCLHDGHHRCVSTYLAGRDYLRRDEYQITCWTYREYLEINHENRWYTPFDPRTHLRTHDISDFKAKAYKLFCKDPIEAVQWIECNKDLYCYPVSDIVTVADLAKVVYEHLPKEMGQN